MNSLRTIQGRTVMNTALAGISSVLLLSIGLIAQRGPDPSPSRPPATAGIDSVKPLIKATDEEWKVIGPKLQAVVTARQAVMTYTANAFGRGGFGGPGDFGSDSLNGPLADSLGFGGRFGRGGGGPGGPEGGRGREGFDPAAFAAMAAARGGPGPGAPAGFGGINNAVSTALAELKTALADPTSSPVQLKTKLAAVRSARQKAALDLATAQKILLRLLTADQEATLVSLGYID
jgi:hypothetical protein